MVDLVVVVGEGVADALVAEVIEAEDAAPEDDAAEEALADEDAVADGVVNVEIIPLLLTGYYQFGQLSNKPAKAPPCKKDWRSDYSRKQTSDKHWPWCSDIRKLQVRKEGR